MSENSVKPAKSLPKSDKKEDEFSKILGHIGKWQYGIFLMLFFSKLPSGWNLLGIVFLIPKAEFQCVQFSGNFTVEVETSTCYENCVEYSFDTTPFQSTLVSEFELICGRHWLASFVQTLLMLGVLVGSAGFGFLSDRYGRKTSYQTSLVTLIIFSLALPFSPNYTTFAILRFLIGFSCGGIMVVSFVILIETFGPKYRDLFACTYQLPVQFGYLIATLFAYFFRSWNSFVLALGLPCLCFLVYYFFLEETPRWLVSVGRVDEASKIVKEAAKKNKLPTEGIEARLEKMSLEIGESKLNKPKLNYLDLVRTPRLRFYTICWSIIWFLNGICYYGTSHYVGNTSSDIFVGVATSAFFQVPSTIITFFLLRRIGRKLTLITFYIISSILLIALAFAPRIYWLTLTLGILASSTVTVTSIVIYIYTSEVFPTVVRNMGMGMCSMTSRLGSMLAPFISYATYYSWFSGVAIAIAAGIAAFFCFFLDETKGLTLPDSIDDVEKINNRICKPENEINAK